MFRSLLALFVFFTAAIAQGVFIGLPIQNQTISAGSSLIVQVQRPNSLTGSEEIAVVIGLLSCANNPCAPPSEDMGTILYNGPFFPQYHEGYMPPYQNFTVQIPSTVSLGTASIGIAHVTLIGAGLYPDLKTLNQTITIV